MIRRAALAVVLALGLLAAPSGVRGQTPGNVQRVGIIHVNGHHHVVVDVVERHVASIEELRLKLQGLKSREVDAYFHTPGLLETSQALLIIEATRGKKLPTMFHEQSLVAKGALASYGTNYQEIGRLSAKYVQRILSGSHPKDLPVENYDKVGFALNLRIAREIGLTLPQSLRLQADQIID
jgi:ABC-type uncharacterized transport system substrate-binding protein